MQYSMKDNAKQNQIQRGMLWMSNNMLHILVLESIHELIMQGTT